MQLLCPKCRTHLNWPDSATLNCSGCSTSYPVQDGIPIVRENSAYYHELLPQDRMRELIGQSRNGDWRSALAEQIAKAPERNRRALHTVFTDENRAAFKAVLPPLQNRRVLDLGCGSGITSIGLARWAREVVSCDLTLERVTFLALRAREMGFTNVRAVCAGDTRPLPFPEGSFDCVVLNGVLEWSAAEGSQPVREGQLAFLGEVRRILKPDGHLYVGIENRYGYTYFLGAPEDHTGVKYAALVPRWAADMLVGRTTGHPYRTYTYGCNELRDLLAEAGFPGTSFFAPIPDYRTFHELYALDGSEPRTGREAGGWRKRIKQRLERSRAFTPSYGVVAGRDKVQPSWIQELADDTRRRLSIQGDRSFPRVKVSATSTAGLIVTLQSRAVVRVALDPVCESRVAKNFAGLERAHGLAHKHKSFLCPQPLYSDRFHGVPYTVESHVSGTSYAGISEQERECGDQQAFDLLIELKTYRDAAAAVLEPADVWREMVVAPLHDLLTRLPDAGERQYVAPMLEFAERGETEPPSVGFTHGDYWWGNVLFNADQGRLALIDWDRWAEQDFSSNDLLHYICYRRMFKTGRQWSDVFSDWLQGSGADRVENAAVVKLAERTGMPATWMRSAALAYWVREVTGHHPSKLLLDIDWRQRMLRAAQSLALHLGVARKSPV